MINQRMSIQGVWIGALAKTLLIRRTTNWKDFFRRQNIAVVSLLGLLPVVHYHVDVLLRVIEFLEQVRQSKLDIRVSRTESVKPGNKPGRCQRSEDTYCESR